MIISSILNTLLTLRLLLATKLNLTRPVYNFESRGAEIFLEIIPKSKGGKILAESKLFISFATGAPTITMKDENWIESNSFARPLSRT